MMSSITRHNCQETLLLELSVEFSEIELDLKSIRNCLQQLEDLARNQDPSISWHDFNNLLNVATLTLDVLHYQLESGKIRSAKQSFQNAQDALREITRTWHAIATEQLS
jgi:hypothetical protein